MSEKIDIPHNNDGFPGTERHEASLSKGAVRLPTAGGEGWPEYRLGMLVRNMFSGDYDFGEPPDSETVKLAKAVQARFDSAPQLSLISAEETNPDDEAAA